MILLGSPHFLLDYLGLSPQMAAFNTEIFKARATERILSGDEGPYNYTLNTVITIIRPTFNTSQFPKLMDNSSNIL
jgi:hypothetical protein